MKKIYFAGSIRGGRDDADMYAGIIDQLRNYGTVLTEHVGYGSPESGEHLSDDEIHERDMKWLMSSDILVAEVTAPSLGVGYEIGRAVEHNIPIVCLFRRGASVSLSAMINGSPALRVFSYRDSDEVRSIIKENFNDF